MAVLMEHGPVVKQLLGDDRVDRDSKDICGCKPLWLAIHSRNTEIVRLLLENSIELNVTVDMVSKHNYGKTQRLILPLFATVGRK